ncbi:MAG: hypothetical protein HKN87_11865 [Saprospiraceae bacterium]|nr:hypothetical protein [Saprospiraceae bacterium]
MKKLMAICFFLSFVGASQVAAQSYDNAVGLRLGWGFGGSFKHFLNETSAVEGILNYRSFGTLGINYNYLQITGLYQKHGPLDEVLTGLQWYFGGGGFIGFYGGSYNGLIDGGGTTIGIAGNVGLDYAFDDIPLNISVDWVPSISINGGGFLSGLGGVAVRYIF